MTETITDSEESPLDPESVEFLLGLPSDEDDFFKNYIEYVANDGLLPYREKEFISHGGKAGESLYIHILNGIFVLDQLRRILPITEIEAQVLFTAFTIHDINKMVPDGDKVKYADLVNKERVCPLIVAVRLDCFFPDYEKYVEDILYLMRGHPRRLFVGIAEALDQRRTDLYQLDQARLEQLALLMKAADTIDLSQTLDEQRKKEQFLADLNEFSDTQYIFISHRITEQRGNFTNVLHNAVKQEIVERFNLTPLLLYPDGVSYLCPRGKQPNIDETFIMAVAKRVAETINDMTSEGFESFIKPGNMGISIDHKCLDLGISFDRLFGVIDTILQKRPYKTEQREKSIRDSIRRTQEILAKRIGSQPDEAQQALVSQVETLLQSGPVPSTANGMRLGELLRTYYIFLLEHFKDRVPNAWQHLYALLELDPQRHAVYEMFDARMDRAYAIIADTNPSSEDVWKRMRKDGSTLLASRLQDDPRVPLLVDYLHRVLIFTGRSGKPADFAAALPHYVKNQHRQCVQCSFPQPTQPWISGDVRSDVKVNVFSNRLTGGPGEPKKQVCGICQLQFLLEKLNYREVRGEQTAYLHLFPYSFQTAPFLECLRITIEQIRNQDVLSGALRLKDAEDSLLQAARENNTRLNFTTRTKEKKAQPFGIYLPRYSSTIGSVLTFPINPVGANDTEKFLFIVQYALLLQRHFGCKVLVSRAVTPPLNKESFGDVYFDMTPLTGRGLIRWNDYHWFKGTTEQEGELHKLWQQLDWLYAIRQQVLTMEGKPLVKLVSAMAEHALQVFYAAEKLAEDKGSESAGWVMGVIAEDVRKLALSIGERDMQELDIHLQRLAKIAWRGGIRGKSLEKHSLMASLDEVLRKLGMLGQELTIEVLQAAAIQDLYEHIVRIHQAESKRLYDACEEFVQVFFDGVFQKVYQGKVARLLNHEKVLRSAFHFYIRQQIPRKKKTASDEDNQAQTDAASDEGNQAHDDGSEESLQQDLF